MLGAVRVACVDGKQEENVEYRKSLSKNTRFASEWAVGVDAMVATV